MMSPVYGVGSSHVKLSAVELTGLRLTLLGALGAKYR